MSVNSVTIQKKRHLLLECYLLPVVPLVPQVLPQTHPAHRRLIAGVAGIQAVEGQVAAGKLPTADLGHCLFYNYEILLWYEF